MDRLRRSSSIEGLSGRPSTSIDSCYLLVDAPLEEASERLAFAFFAWRFSFSDLLAAVFEEIQAVPCRSVSGRNAALRV